MKGSLVASLAAAMTGGGSTVRRPFLRGVVFDMDGTLTVPNLDFEDMYRRCAVDPSKDILEEVAAMPEDRQIAANRIIGEMEEEGRRTLQLMPGAGEVLRWLASHGIPTALVTRNTRESADVLAGRLLSSSPPCRFSAVIARDDGLPPKPDPAALEAIAGKWGVPLPSDGILMVGDSVSNDIIFGKNAGVRTALLGGARGASPPSERAADPDIEIGEDLGSLPGKLWSMFEIPGPLGTGATNLHGLPAPRPRSDLARAAFGGDAEALGSLLDSGAASPEAAVDEADGSGNTALIWAAEGGHAEAVQRLLAVPGIDVNRRGYLGATAANRAARRGHGEVLKLLIKAGADVNAPNDKLQFPLHFAAFKQNIEAVEILLENGANPRALDRKGRTPAEDTRSEAIRDRILKATVV